MNKNIIFDKINLFNITKVNFIIPNYGGYEILIEDLQENTKDLFIKFTEYIIEKRKDEVLSLAKIKHNFILFFRDRPGSSYSLYNLYLAYLSFIHIFYNKQGLNAVPVEFSLSENNNSIDKIGLTSSLNTIVSMTNFKNKLNSFFIYIKPNTSFNKKINMIISVSYNTTEPLELELIK